MVIPLRLRTWWTCNLRSPLSYDPRHSANQIALHNLAGNCHDAQLKSAWLRNGVNSQMRKVWSLWKIVFLTAAKMPNKKVLGFGMVCGQHVTFGQHCFCVSLLYFTKIILNIHKTRVHTCIFVYCDKVWCLWPMFFFDNCHYVQPKSTYLFFWQLS